MVWLEMYLVCARSTKTHLNSASSLTYSWISGSQLGWDDDDDDHDFDDDDDRNDLDVDSFARVASGNSLPQFPSNNFSSSSSASFAGTGYNNANNGTDSESNNRALYFVTLSAPDLPDLSANKNKSGTTTPPESMESRTYILQIFSIYLSPFLFYLYL